MKFLDLFVGDGGDAAQFLEPVGHTLRPAGDAYPREEAADEARRFLAGRPYVRRDEVRTLAVHR